MDSNGGGIGARVSTFPIGDPRVRRFATIPRVGELRKTLQMFEEMGFTE